MNFTQKGPYLQKLIPQTTTRSRRRLMCLRAESPPVTQYPAKFSDHKSCESGNINFQIAK